MRERRLTSLVILIMTVLIIGCGGPPPPPVEWETLDQFDFNVAEADPNLQIPAKHLYEWIYFSRAAAAGEMVNDSVIQFRRDSILIDTLLGLTSPEFDLSVSWHRFMEYRELSQASLRQIFWQKELGERIDIDSPTVVKFYEAYPEMFSLPGQNEMYHILSSPLGFLQGRDSALYFDFSRDDLESYTAEYIQQLYGMIKYGEAFENVARNFSHDLRSRDGGGRLGWVVPGTYYDPFDSVVQSLAVHEVSRPYQDGDGWHLLYKNGHIKGGPQPLDSIVIWDRAAQGAFDVQAMAFAPAILDSLKQLAVTKRNDSLSLPEVSLHDFKDNDWALVINGTDTVYARALKMLEDDYALPMGTSVDDPKVRELMIEHVIGPVLINQAAREKGYDTLPEQVAFDRRTWHKTVKSYQLSELYGRTDWSPTEAQIKKYYDSHWDDYHPKNHIRAEQLVVGDLELAHYLLEQAAQGMSFADLIVAFGPEGEGYNIVYEDLGIIETGRFDPALEDALLRTHAYRLTDVIETKRGFHIGRVIERKYDQPLEMVRADVRSKLIDEHRWAVWKEFRDDLFKKNHVRFPGKLTPFYLPPLSERNHPRVLPKQNDALPQ